MNFPKVTEAISDEVWDYLVKKTQKFAGTDLIMAFEAKDYKDRVHLVMALKDDKEIMYVANGFGIPKNIFKVLLYHNKNDWLYVSSNAEKLLYADLLIEVL